MKCNRRYPTVENRVRLAHTGDGGYVPPPPDSEFVRLFMSALSTRTSPTKQVLVITKKAPVSSSSPAVAPAVALGPVVFLSRKEVTMVVQGFCFALV